MMFILLSTTASADTGFSGYGSDCYCTDKQSQRIELGQRICMYVGGRSFVAECQMSQNVPMWREVDEICPGASIAPNMPWSPLQLRYPLQG